MNIVYEVSKSRLPTFEQNMIEQSTNMQSEDALPTVASQTSYISTVRHQDWAQSSNGQQQRFNCIDPWLLKFQDTEIEKIYEQSRFKELIWQSKQLFKFRIVYALFIIFDAYQNISSFDKSNEQ
jgi:hypothetical protein